MSAVLSSLEEDYSPDREVAQLRIPPHSLEAEKGVLGCVLLAPHEGMGLCVEKLKSGASAFYDLRHQALYELLIVMYDRKEAIERMIRAIDDYHISGVKTTLDFCRMVMNHEAFVSGNFDTHFVKNHFSPEMLSNVNEEELELAAYLAVKLLREHTVPVPVSNGGGTNTGNWKNNRLN